MSEFDSAWRKWRWGGIHSDALKACFKSGGTAKPLIDPSVVSNYDRESQCIVLTISAVNPLPDEWALRLGDVVNNYRAALDHLAWAVVQRGSKANALTDRQERGVYYPLAFSDTDFNSQTANRLPGATPTDLAVVRRYQPDEKGDTHCLAVLVSCSNLDKHRTLQTMPLCVAQSQLTINRLIDCEVIKDGDSLINSDPLQPGAEIGRIPVRPTGPYPQAYMNGRFGLAVAIENRVWVRDWLNEIQTFVGNLLAEFADSPKGVLYIPAAEWANISGDE